MSKKSMMRCAVCVVSLVAACSNDSGGGSDPDAAIGTCGNGACDPGEDVASCSSDCRVRCGDGTCESDESTTSCPADCHDRCGDGVCQPGETISTCAADCSTAACTTNPDTCTGETLCIARTCQNAFGRNYKVNVVSAVFTEKKANGDAWDIAGGLPDGKVTLTINGAPQLTPVVDDTLMPVWNFVTPPTLIPGGTNFKIEVVDADLASDDPAWSCVINPLTAEVIRSHARCSGTGALMSAHVDFTFTPN